MDRSLLSDPRVAAALEQLQSRIAARYPAATFDVFYRDDPDGFRLRATVDLVEPSELMDDVVEMLYALQVEQGLPVYVVAVQSPERVREQLRRLPRWRVPATPSVSP